MMARMVLELQNDCFAAAQALAKLNGDDYRGTYSRYIGELEGMLMTLSRKNRKTEKEIEEMLRNVRDRFRSKTDTTHEEFVG